MAENAESSENGNLYCRCGIHDRDGIAGGDSHADRVRTVPDRGRQVMMVIVIGIVTAAVFAGILIAAGMAIKQMDEFLEDSGE